MSLSLFLQNGAAPRSARPAEHGPTGGGGSAGIGPFPVASPAGNSVWEYPRSPAHPAPSPDNASVFCVGFFVCVCV